MHERKIGAAHGARWVVAGLLIFGSACESGSSTVEKPRDGDVATSQSAKLSQPDATVSAESATGHEGTRAQPAGAPKITAKVAGSLDRKLGSIPANPMGETLPEPREERRTSQSVSLDSTKPRSRAEAWEELRALHAAGIERQLDQLRDERRRKVEAHFESLGRDPHDLGLYFTGAGTPASLPATGFDIAPRQLGLSQDATEGEMARAFVRRYAGIWGIDEHVVTASHKRTRHSSMGEVSTVEYRQRYKDIPVIDAGVNVVLDEEGSVRGAVGSFLPTEELRGLEVQPAVAAEAAKKQVQPGSRASRGEAQLVIYSRFMAGEDPDPRLAWEVPVKAATGGLNARVYVDADQGKVLGRNQLARYDLRRSHWDMREMYNADACQLWRKQTPVQFNFQPSTCELTTSACQQCQSNAEMCMLCACEDPNEPSDAGCETDIWQYDDRTTNSCVSDGFPSANEPDCRTQAQSWWAASEEVYDFWNQRFGRDSWNNEGSYMFTMSNLPEVPSNPNRVGVTRPAADLDNDGVDEFAVSGTEAEAAKLNVAGGTIGHELGHMLQFGIPVANPVVDFYDQGKAAMEHTADVHSYSYKGVHFGQSFICNELQQSHYTQIASDPDRNLTSINRNVGNCNGWLMSQDDEGTVEHYGVQVSPLQNLAHYDRIRFRAMEMMGTQQSYFHWWNIMVDAAALEFGFGSVQHIKTDQAVQSVGVWSRFIRSSVPGSKEQDEGMAATSRVGAPAGPCVFYRHDVRDPREIYVTCRDGNGAWTPEAIFNAPSIRPAAAAPAATTATLCGSAGCQDWALAFWPRRDTGQIMARGVRLTDLAVTPIDTLGTAHRSHAKEEGGRWPVSAAALGRSETSEDRIVVAYHHADFPEARFRYTIVKTSQILPHVDMGDAVASSQEPSLVSYPYPDRVYFVRPDDSEPFRIRGTSFPGGSEAIHPATNEGWRSPTDLTSVISPSTDVDLRPNTATTTDRVAMAAYGRTSSERRLRLVFTRPNFELWYATLSEASAGELTREATVVSTQEDGDKVFGGGYNPVPLTRVMNTTSMHAGALAADPNGWPLWHFWGVTGPTVEDSPVLGAWRTFSD